MTTHNQKDDKGTLEFGNNNMSTLTEAFPLYNNYIITKVVMVACIKNCILKHLITFTFIFVFYYCITFRVFAPYIFNDFFIGSTIQRCFLPEYP